MTRHPSLGECCIYECGEWLSIAVAWAVWLLICPCHPSTAHLSRLSPLLLLPVEAILIFSVSLIRHFKVDVLPNFQRCVLLQLFSCTTSLSITSLFYWLSVAQSITTTLFMQVGRIGLSWKSYWRSSPYWISCLFSFYFYLPHRQLGVSFEQEQLCVVRLGFASILSAKRKSV